MYMLCINIPRMMNECMVESVDRARHPPSILGAASWVLHDGRGSFFIVVDNVMYD